MDSERRGFWLSFFLVVPMLGDWGIAYVDTFFALILGALSIVGLVSQPAILTAWMCLGRESRTTRISIGALAAMAIWLLKVRFFVTLLDDDVVEAVITATLILLPRFAVVPIAIGAPKLFRASQRRDELQPHQFGLKQLLAWTAAACLVFAVARWVLPMTALVAGVREANWQNHAESALEFGIVWALPVLSFPCVWPALHEDGPGEKGCCAVGCLCLVIPIILFPLLSLSPELWGGLYIGLYLALDIVIRQIALVIALEIGIYDRYENRGA